MMELLKENGVHDYWPEMGQTTPDGCIFEAQMSFYGASHWHLKSLNGQTLKGRGITETATVGSQLQRARSSGFARNIQSEMHIILIKLQAAEMAAFLLSTTPKSQICLCLSTYPQSIHTHDHRSGCTLFP